MARGALEAIASSREGLVPPTLCPWKYNLQKQVILFSLASSNIAPGKIIRFSFLYLATRCFPYLLPVFPIITNFDFESDKQYPSSIISILFSGSILAINKKYW